MCIYIYTIFCFNYTIKEIIKLLVGFCFPFFCPSFLLIRHIFVRICKYSKCWNTYKISVFKSVYEKIGVYGANIHITVLIIMPSKVGCNCKWVYPRFIGGSCTAVICPSSLGRLQGHVLFYIVETTATSSIS